MKESKTLIIGLVVFIFLVLVVSGFFFSGRAEVYEPEGIILGEPNDGDVLIETPEGDYIWVADEPNEPKCQGHDVTAIYCPECHGDFEVFRIWEPNDISVVSLDFIPTWPDYIELEKDLYIDDEGVGGNNGWTLNWVLRKGTKIYFKD